MFKCSSAPKYSQPSTVTILGLLNFMLFPIAQYLFRIIHDNNYEFEIQRIHKPTHIYESFFHVASETDKHNELYYNRNQKLPLYAMTCNLYDGVEMHWSAVSYLDVLRL